MTYEQNISGLTLLLESTNHKMLPVSRHVYTLTGLYAAELTSPFS
jgi:hypothetical protein